MGVAMVFTPGASTHEIVDWVYATFGEPAPPWPPVPAQRSAAREPRLVR